jgi:hypothetical protein
MEREHITSILKKTGWGAKAAPQKSWAWSGRPCIQKWRSWISHAPFRSVDIKALVPIYRQTIRFSTLSINNNSLRIPIDSSALFIKRASLFYLACISH